jgi:NAD(P)-dependent dehydrogenase (short-subunit alcohol dehydrogenase family)
MRGLFQSEGAPVAGRLEGKVVLITGGGTGIGRVCAVLFAREGARVAVAGRRTAPLHQVADEIISAGGEALAIACDVSQARQAEQCVRTAVERFGRLDILVNNAGALHVATAEGTSENDWSRLMDTNAKGVFLMSRAAMPELRRAGGGAIVNIGSILGLIGMKNRAAYCASKGAVTLLTKAMALDHAAEGVRVNCICPSLVETELVQGLFTSQPDPKAARQARVEQIPLGRLGRPEDVANLALFLASEESSWITGAAIPLDGGLSAY